MHALNRYRNTHILPALFSEHIEPEPKPSFMARRRNRNGLFHETVTARIRRIGKMALSQLRTSNLLGLVRKAQRNLRGAAQEPAVDAEYFAPLRDVSAAHLADHYINGLFAESGLLRARLRAPATRRIIDLTTYKADTAPLSSNTFTYDTHTDYVIARTNASRSHAYSTALLHGFAELADKGMAHSVEMRSVSGLLTAGIFGVSTGRVFVLQGLFALDAQAESAILEHLLNLLKQKNFILADLTPAEAVSHKDEQQISKADFTTCVRAHQPALQLEPWTNVAPKEKRSTQSHKTIKIAA